VNSPIRIGIVGVGKIARDQHIPAIAANPAFILVAAASRHPQRTAAANFPTLEAMLDGVHDLDAVAICTPTPLHYGAAKLALARGKHVLLEKPPCASLVQLENLVSAATGSGTTFFPLWHSQHARGVADAMRLLRQRQVRRVRVIWKEDVRRWHPGQGWITEPGGFGVLDAGINALSILCKLFAEPILVKSAKLWVPALPSRGDADLEHRNRDGQRAAHLERRRSDFKDRRGGVGSGGG
jgi:D-galactose 1-dehydrogenase